MRLALASLSILAACGTDFHQAPPPDAAAPAAPTWYQDAAPIVAAHCMGCHQAGGIAPFSLTGYADARDNAQAMLAQIDAGNMPPFDAREEPACTPRFGWKDDPRLSPADIATLHAWVDGGTQEGTAAPVPAPPATGLSGITETLAPSTPFSASGDRDEFTCFILDPGAAGTWVTGLQVRPGNASVVHHVVVSEMTPGADLDALVAAHGLGQPYSCDGAATPSGLVISIWTPGNEPVETPPDLAIPLVAGSKIVMQIHYHPTGGTDAPDTTSIDLRTSSAWPKRMYFVTALGNAPGAPDLLPDPDDRTSSPEFRIPANASAHTEHMRFTIPDLGGLSDVRLYSVNPHMHLLGTHISGRIERPAARGTDPQDECLANGTWNFDWQRTYVYDAPLDQLPSVAPGDVLDIRCTWDNTIENPFEQRLMHDAGLVAPADVYLGEQTTNEMCLEIFGLSVPAPAQPAARRAPTLADLPRAFAAR